MSNAKRVIITGASGFVGANLARYLLAQGHTVHLLVRPEWTRWRLASIQSELHIHEIDLNDAPTLNTLIRSIRPEWIFHLAAYGAYSYQNDLAQMLRTNLNATVNLVEACLQVGFEAFVNTGSSSEYGFKDHPPSESEWLEPNSYYAVTKASATMYCRYTAQKYKVHLPTMRLYSIYGPYEEPTRLMPKILVEGYKNSFPPLVEPSIARDYVYSEDVNRAYWLAATQPDQELGAVYNVGSSVQTTLGEVVETARRSLAIAASPVWGSMPNRQWDTSVWVADNRKIQAQLGWRPDYSFEQGFGAMAKWLETSPDLWPVYNFSPRKS